MALANPYNYKKPQGFVAQPRAAVAKKGPAEVPKAKHDAYLEQKIMSAKPEELTYMLYEGLVRFIKKAKLFNDQKNIPKTHDSILRAEAIVAELRSTLNMDIEVSNQLDSLYEFMLNHLMEANLEKSNTKLDEVLGLSEDLKETWKQAMDSLK